MNNLSLPVSPVNEPPVLDRSLVANFIAQLGGLSAADRFNDCGEGGRGYVGVCRNDGCSAGSNVYHSFRCMLRICPTCASAASHKLAEKLVTPIVLLVRKSPARLGLKHITLTTNICLLDYVKFDKNGRIVSVALDALQIVMQRLRRRAAQMMRKFCEGVEGCGFAIGIEFGSNLMLHFHVLALCPFWPQRELSESWREYSNGCGFIVDIREAARELEDIEKAVGYVSKYVTKPLGKKKENAPRRASRVLAFVERHGQECIIAALWYVFRGVRRFQTYGSFYDLEMPPDDLEVCPHCGGKLTWLNEVDFCLKYRISGLHLLKTNNFVGEEGQSPPKIIQLGFAGWASDVDFWK